MARNRKCITAGLCALVFGQAWAQTPRRSIRQIQLSEKHASLR